MKDDSALEDISCSGSNLTGLDLTRSSVLKDLRISGTNVSGVLFEKSSLADAQFSGSNISSVTTVSSELNGIAITKASISKCVLTDTKLNGFAAENVDLTLSAVRSVLSDVSITRTMGMLISRDEISCVDSAMENCKFTDCNLHRTVFKGVKISGIKLTGKDLSNRIIEKPEDLD